MNGKFPPAWIDELVARTDIVQVVSSHTPLKQKGRKYWGLCPFHGEKTASFSVDPDSQLYYCFGCKAGGGPIRFLMDIDRLTFREAIEQLADQAHMAIPETTPDPNYYQKKQLNERLLDANREAARFYHQTLFTPVGKASMDYLRSRGLDDNTIRKFGLGASPDSWDALTKHLTGMGYTLNELKQAGLTIVRPTEPATETTPAKPERAFDFFRGRVMFPIINKDGQVLGFGGRVLGKGEPKYMNTTDTPVYNKRINVFAANLLHKERHLDRVILTEGYMDVIALTQFGVKGVVATLGTALTPEQASLLKRYAPKIFLAYDGDSAGQKAILRGLDIMKAAGIPVRVLDFPDGLDPDEFIRRDGADGFAALPAISPEEYRIRRLKEQFDLSTQEGRTEYVKACAPILRDLEPVDLENHLTRLNIQTGFPRDVLLAQISRTAPEKPAAAPPPRPEPIRTPQQKRSGEDIGEIRAQELILSLIAGHQVPADIASLDDFTDPLLRDLYTALRDGRSPASLADAQPDDASRSRVSKLLISHPTEDTSQLLQMAEDCLNGMRKKTIQKKISAIKEQINHLEGTAKQEALTEYSSLLREEARLNKK